jgi:hypothetical protein
MFRIGLIVLHKDELPVSCRSEHFLPDQSPLREYAPEVPAAEDSDDKAG